MEDVRINGTTLKIIRVLFNKSQGGIASIIGKRQTTISNVENGVQEALTKKDSKTLCEELGLTFGDFANIQKLIRTTENRR
jgi:transcriptional regulator with XRE-family HTH domain